MPTLKKTELLKLPNLAIRTEGGVHRIYIDDEEVDFMISSVELTITPDMCVASFCIPLESIDLDLNDVEFKIKAKLPEVQDAD